MNAHPHQCMARRRPNRKTGFTIGRLKQHAAEVMRVLGKGHSERVYHRAMITSLNQELVPHRSEVVSPIFFKGEVVGFGRCDIIVGNLVIEFKANVTSPTKASTQLRKYMLSLSATERKRFNGVIINFNQRSGTIETHQERRR